MHIDALAQQFRGMVKRRYWLRNLYYLMSDVRAEWRLSKGIFDTDSGTTHASLDLNDSLDYVTGVFGDYKIYSGVDRFRGRIAEVGAGDNCGVAMLFRHDGCSSIDLPDRFYSKRTSVHQANIYKELWKRYPTLPEILGDPDPMFEEGFVGIHRYHGLEASCERFFDTHHGYDYIVSRSVLEHVSDPRMALESMANALTATGQLIHKVDLRDHGMHSNYCRELKFLESPTWLHSRMTRSSGGPNRNLINVYRDTLRSLGMSHKFMVTRLANIGDINPHVPYEDIPIALKKKAIAYVNRIRPKLAKAFRDVSDEDISITGFFLLASR